LIVVIVLNVIGWPIIHMLISKLAFQKSLSDFESPRWYLQTFAWENRGRFYERYLKVKQWKKLLPDGAKILGHSFSKNSVRSKDPAYLKEFVLETKRGEWAHWLTICCAPIFFIWNPLWADMVMVGYALVANLPCIIAQRYNRQVIERMLARKRRLQ